jgi:hypothetical protein
VVELAIKSVRGYYCPQNGSRSAPEEAQRKMRGQFTYSGGGGGTVAMAAAGVVCMQEFGQYDDWRIGKSMQRLTDEIQAKKKKMPNRRVGELPFDAYTLYYVGQAIYQVGGEDWQRSYPILRDYITASQVQSDDPKHNGHWVAGSKVGGEAGKLYGTSVGCFILAIPNRYLPILQDGKIESLKKKFKLQ